MAVVQICLKMQYKDQTLSSQKEVRQNERCFMSPGVSSQEIIGSSHLILSNSSRRRHISCDVTETETNTRRGRCVSQGKINNRWSMPFPAMTEASAATGSHHPGIHSRPSSYNHIHRERPRTARHALESGSNEKQLESLHSYFGKLPNDTDQKFTATLPERKDLLHKSDGQLTAKTGLQSLDNYLGKLYEDEASNSVSCVEILYSVGEDSENDRLEKSTIEGNDIVPASSYDETSNLYLISILASINIAVFLFEIASPVRNSDPELFSVPLLYGAKINHLILTGEWWRLVTPIFLHAGFLHVALGCWVLLSFGPLVCRSYGSFTFFLIYILGGISGNLISFLHTPEPTVCGTGPTFAVIGAWLIYQIQNRDVIDKEEADSMFQKAILATALSFILSNFGLIDDWTHSGAAIAGALYGFLTCPALQVDNTSSARANQEEGIGLVSAHADPCKSLIFFLALILVLSSLLLIVEPPLALLDADRL